MNPLEDDYTQLLHSLAFAQLTEYINKKRRSENIAVFRLADLGSLYEERLQSMGLQSARFHTFLFESSATALVP